jgi:hypothetical protein
MLQRFLRTMQTGEAQSLPEMAREMGLSPEMVLQILQDLTHKGYLLEIGADCAAPQGDDFRGGCSDCPAHSSCQVNIRQWFLTEKGRAAVSRPPVGNAA